MRVHRMAGVSISFAKRVSDEPCCEAWKLAEQHFQPVRPAVQKLSRALNGSHPRGFVQGDKANEGRRPCFLAASVDQEVCGPATQSTPFRLQCPLAASPLRC